MGFLCVSQPVDRREIIAFWAHAFEINGPTAEFAHRAAVRRATRDQVFTGHLPGTSAFFSSLAAGDVQALGVPSGRVNFATALDLLALAHTHQRIAMSGVAPMSAPAFWVYVGDRRLPALPLAQLRRLSGLEPRIFDLILAQLVADKAFCRASHANCAEALVAMPGFLSGGR